VLAELSLAASELELTLVIAVKDDAWKAQLIFRLLLKARFHYSCFKLVKPNYSQLLNYQIVTTGMSG
jgi:hypothetical protein